ncbi:MAG TPA: hypothetical protein VFN20_11175, partial [Candidatus Acidoferrum sp.]|nr:hypothetical protein [Candidatus Acidoferrum sp.]
MSRLKPALMVFLLAFAAIQPVASAQNGPPRSAKPRTYPTPTAREILDRSVRATGGMNAWLKLTSLSWKADVTDDTAKFMTGKLEVNSKAPDKMALCLKLNLGYFACRAYDGKAGWGDDAKNGLVTLEGPRLE